MGLTMSNNAKHLFKRFEQLPFMELRQVQHSAACYHSHAHDEFSFGVIDAGQAVYKNQTQQHSIGQGLSVTINPGDVHSCNPKQGQWSYRMLFVESAWVGQVQQEMLACPASDYLAFERQLVSDKQTYALLNQLFLKIQLEQNPLEQESLLLAFFEQQFASQQRFRSDVSSVAKPQLQRVRECIQDQLQHNLSLSELAAIAGLSRYHLVRSFKQVYGLSPHAFQLNQRINRAKGLLREGRSIVDTANQLGFADQSHFQRNFKKRIALTPRQYRACFT